ncbi:MAG: methyltransferase [Candidatus Micrarchaeota archaeon]
MSKLTNLANAVIKEGNSIFTIPKQSLVDPHHCTVFYNPAMEFNRNLSALFLKSCLDFTKIKPNLLFDGFCGVGVRGIRYAKECDAANVVLCDASDATIPYVKKNVAVNKLQKKCKVMHMDVNQALSSLPLCDVIEMDPFGSPIQNIDSAFRRGKPHFILSLTFTDLANLCGGHKDACKRYYDAASINCEFSHELALRIILQRVGNIASMHEFGITPLVSWYQGHYVKVFLLCEKGAAKADSNFNKIGYAWLCRNCNSHGVGKDAVSKCPSCGNKTQIAGPLWIEKYSNKEIIRNALVELNESKIYEEKKKQQLATFLELLIEDIEEPLFYSLPELCSSKSIGVPKTETFLTKLRGAGFKATRTHFTPYGFRTDAPLEEILKII